MDTPFSDSGSTIAGAEVQRRSQALACSVVSRGTLGVWYVVQASAVDNTCITVSTARSDFNTILAVYNGTCNNLTCVTENDDSSSLVRTSQVSFTAERGVLYYVFVGGADDDDAGDFIFSLLEVRHFDLRLMSKMAVLFRIGNYSHAASFPAATRLLLASGGSNLLKEHSVGDAPVDA